MSLAINVDKITRVLLADGWHEVKRIEAGRSSFTLDSYEYVTSAWFEDPKTSRVLHGGGNSGVCATGFEFLSAFGKVAGPLTAILAVETED